MFNKLSVLEKAKLYAAVAELETHYTPEAVNEGLQLMADRLDGIMVKPANGLAVEAIIGSWDNQLELLPFEPETPEAPEEPKRKEVKTKRNCITRSPHGLNDRKIREWCTKVYPALAVDEAMLSLYYMDNLTQTAIAKKIGVKQRAVGYYIERIPEKVKKETLSRWGVKL